MIVRKGRREYAGLKLVGPPERPGAQRDGALVTLPVATNRMNHLAEAC